MRLSVAVAVACLTVVGLATATETEAAIKKHTNIPAQPLRPALQQLSRERSIQLIFRTDIVGDIRTSGAIGEFTMDEALTQLLTGTGLTFRYLDDKTITILPVSSTRATAVGAGPNATFPGSDTENLASRRPTSGTDSASSHSKSFWSRFRIAQADTATAGGSSAAETKSSTHDTANRPRHIEEIIVTATKRSERLQDVPVSIAVITNQDIERRGLIGMEDYLRSIPGVNQIDRGSIDNAVIIRGITTSPTVENFGSGATVATYFDETPITGVAGLLGGGIDVRPVDIERIEVLRGPQGTTFGSSSLGGTLRIIPAKPRLDDFGAKVTASYSDTSGLGSGNSMFQGAINVPIVDSKFAVRAVGYRYEESGIYQNLVGVDPAASARAASWGIADDVRDYTPIVGRMVSTGGRLAADWQISEALEISVNVLTQDIEQEGYPAANLGTYGEISVGTYEQISFPIDSSVRLDGEKQEGYHNGIDLLSLVLNYDLGWAGLTSATSWVEGETEGVRDGWTVSRFFGGFSLPDESYFDSMTQEIRLASQLDGRVQFLMGLFYEDVEPGNLQLLIPFGAPAANPFGTDPAFVADRDFQTKQRAVFGEISYDLTQNITATIGGRYFDYDKKERLLREGGLVGVPLGTGVPNTIESAESDSTFKANLTYQLADTSLLYAAWAQGFRLGKPTSGVPPICDSNNDGIIDGTNVTLASTLKVNSDRLDNYEIGGKFTLLNRRLVLDTAIYHIEWDQLPVSAVAPTCSLFYLVNGGAATSYGAEFQASLFAVEGLRFDFGAGYTRGELSEDVPAQNWRKGSRLPGSPNVNVNLAAQYDFNVATRKAFVRLDSFYTGAFYPDLNETPALRSGDYIMLGARAGVTLGNLSLEVYGRNLTNQDDATWRGVGVDHRLRPRTVGVQLSYDF